MGKSTTTRRAGKLEKPQKPYDGFPLFPHASGRWAKKIRGRTHFFGRWARVKSGKLCAVDDIKAEAEAAEALYAEQRDDLHAGRVPRAKKLDGLTIKAMCNAFLIEKRNAMNAGEISPRTFSEYFGAAERLMDALGSRRFVDDLLPGDFGSLRATLAKTRGPVALGNEIQRVRTLFKHAFENGLIPKPAQYGTAFDKPSAKVVRIARASRGQRMFEADELRKIIKAAGQPLKAFVLLGVNCGFGAADISSLPRAAVSLETGWLDFARVKTGVPRRCKLWPETVEAIREAMHARPAPHHEADAALAFLTPSGRRWVHHTAAGDQKAWTSRQDLVSIEFTKLSRSLKMDGRGFYCLRRTFQTIAEDVGDFPAVGHVMGHAPQHGDMSATYRQRISDDRLNAVAEMVRAWLFGPMKEKRKAAK